MYIYALIIVLLIALIYYTRPRELVYIRFGGVEYGIVADFSNYAEAARMLNRLNNDILRFLQYLKVKYHINESYEQHAGHLRYIAQSQAYADAGAVSRGYVPPEHNPEIIKIVDYLLTNHNTEVWHETDPRTTSDTSYNLNKGEKLYICIRDKKNPEQILKYNDVMFVVIHEIAHTAAYMVVGHPERFWEIFKFLLHEAVNCGIYAPVDYSKTPIDYCGLHVAYSPLFDKNLKKIY